MKKKSILAVRIKKFIALNLSLLVGMVLPMTPEIQASQWASSSSPVQNLSDVLDSDELPLDPLQFNLPKTASEVVWRRTENVATFQLSRGKYVAVSFGNSENLRKLDPLRPEPLDPKDFDLPETAVEIVEKRTEKAVTFMLGGGRHVAISDGSVKFVKNKNGFFVPVNRDGKRIGHEYVFEGLADNVSIRFDLKRPRYTMSKGEDRFAFEFKTKAKGKIIDARSVSYRLAPHVNLVWKVVENRVEKHIWIEKPGPLPDLSFTVTPSGKLTLELLNNQIRMRNAQNESVFETMPVFLADENGGEIKRDVTIVEAGGHFYYQFDQSGLPYPYAIDPATSAASAGTVSQEVYGSAPWSNLSNIAASDNSYATVSLPAGEKSYYLKATNFGFALAGNEYVSDAAVTIERKASAANQAYDFFLSQTYGGWIVNPNRAGGTYNLLISNSDSTQSMLFSRAGIIMDSATRANDSLYGVVYAVYNKGASSVTVSVDHITLKLYYFESGKFMYGYPFHVTFAGQGRVWSDINDECLQAKNCYPDMWMPAGSTPVETQWVILTKIKTFNGEQLVPPDATIDGIQVALNAAGFNSNYYSRMKIEAQLMRDGSGAPVPAGNPGFTKEMPDVFPDGTQISSGVAYGNSTDKWGVNWTAAMVNHDNFGFRFRVIKLEPEKESYFLVQTNIILVKIFFNHGGGGVTGTGLTITNVSLIDRDAANNTVKVKFDITWEYSWRNDINYDAAWVFIKWSDDGGVTWSHATLENDGVNPAGFGAGAGTGVDIFVPPDRRGGFIYRKANGAGTLKTDEIKFKWSYGTDGVADSDTVRVAVMGVLMVYVPAGSFYAGDTSSTGALKQGSGDTDPWSITSDAAISVTAAASDGYYYVTDSQGEDDATGSVFSIPLEYPAGYDDFYVMRHEITEEMYVDFLNTLTRAQQQTRTAADTSGDTITRYVMSNTAGMTYRNNIQAPTSGNGTTNPVVFSTTRGSRAAGYLSWMDLAALADWAGLRPMTELEFEKAARGNEQSAVSGEYAWGTTTIAAAEVISGTEDGTETVVTPGANANHGDKTFTGGDASKGALRVGIFATPTSDRTGAGAGYYGVLNMSDNIREMTVSIGSAAARSFTGSPGTGALTTTASYEGNATNTDWPGIDGTSSRGVTGAAGAGFRGAGFDSVTIGHMAVSNRSSALHASEADDRDPSNGGRLVRTA